MSLSQLKTMSSIGALLNPFDDLGEVYYTKQKTGRVENGRVYIRDRSEYLFPVDELEAMRLDLIARQIGRVFLGIGDNDLSKPLVAQSPRKILDLGAGTGSWSLDMAARFPNAEVVAVDLVESLPKDMQLPRNLKRILLDFEKPQWNLGEGTFDLIHMSQLCGSVSNWDRMFSKCFRHLAPGGELELIEMDWTPRCDDKSLPANSELHRWWDLMQRATPVRSIAYPTDLGDMLEQAGLIQVHHYGPYHIPINDWPKVPGTTAEEDYVEAAFNLGSDFCWSMTSEGGYHGLEALTMGPFTRNLGMTPQEVRDFVRKVESCIKKRRHHGYHNLHMWTAKKPV